MYAINYFFYNIAIRFLKPSTVITEINPYPERGISHFPVTVLSTDIHQDVSRHVRLEYGVGPDDSITG